MFPLPEAPKVDDSEVFTMSHAYLLIFLKLLSEKNATFFSATFCILMLAHHLQTNLEPSG